MSVFAPKPADTTSTTPVNTTSTPAPISDRHPGAHPSLAAPAQAYVPQSTHPVCGVIGPHMIISGDIQFQGELLIQGTVTGNISSQNDEKSILRIDEKASVTGDVDVPVVKVAGTLRGNVSASELLHLQPSGHIEGPVKYNNIQLESGGTLSGSLSPEFKNARK